MRKTRGFLLAAAAAAMAFTFSCSGDNSGSSEQSYGYCITASGCLTGPFTASTCNGQPSNSCPNSSSSKAVVPSSSSKAVVQEYCVFRSSGGTLCGVIEPIGSTRGCPVGTKMDYCPFGYDMINLDLLQTCVKACSSSNMGSSCSKCGGSINSSNGTCTARAKFCY